MKKLLIRIIMLFRPFWISIGVQPNQLEAILVTKLKMDGRRVGTFSRNMQSKNKNNLDLITMGYFFFLGLFGMAILIGIDIPVSAFSLYLTVWMVVLALTLISDFTDVLIDVRDNYILLPRPVNDRTLTVSRLLHIFSYLAGLMISFMLPGLIYVIIKYGILESLVFCFIVFLSVLMTIFIVNMTYLLILRVTTEQKFKEIINYFQIGFVIAIMTGYYILPRLIDFESFESFDIMETTWGYFLPGTWLGNIWSVLVDADFDSIPILMAGLGLLSPVIALYLVVKVLSKNFSQKLMGLGQGSGGEEDTIKKKSGAQPTNRHMNWWTKMITKSVTEKAGFKASWLITARSRDYKLKTYPLFGFIPAFFIYMALDGEGSLAERMQEMIASDSYILLIYICIYGMVVPIFNLKYSERHKSSWIFYALPIEKPGLFLKGAVKAMIARFVFPIFLLSAIVVLAIWGFKTIDDILVGTINVLLIAAMVGKGILKTMPFTESWTTQSKGSNFSWSFGIMFLLGILGTGHWAVMTYPLLLLIWAVIAFGLMWWQFKSFDVITWNEIK